MKTPDCTAVIGENRNLAIRGRIFSYGMKKERVCCRRRRALTGKGRAERTRQRVVGQRHKGGTEKGKVAIKRRKVESSKAVRMGTTKESLLVGGTCISL